MSYLFIQSSFVVLSIVCIAFTIIGLRHALRSTNSSQSINKSTLILSLVLIVWVSLISALSINGFFLDFSAIPPRMIVVMLPPILVLVIIIRRKQFVFLLKTLPVTWLLYLQAFRFFVEILLWGLCKLELIPVLLTFEGRNFDIIVGISAPIVAILYNRKIVNNLFIRVWNVLGILVLANIVITAVLSMPTPFRVFMEEPANTQVVLFPIVWLPAILVPIAYYLHVFSLIQLKNLSDQT